MWGKIIIPMYRLWLHGLYGLYGPRCPLSPKSPINLISLSLSLSLSLAVHSGHGIDKPVNFATDEISFKFQIRLKYVALHFLCYKSDHKEIVHNCVPNDTTTLTP